MVADYEGFAKAMDRLVGILEDTVNQYGTTILNELDMVRLDQCFDNFNIPRLHRTTKAREGL